MAKSKKADDVMPLALMEGKLRAPTDADLEASCPTLHRCLSPIWKDGKCVRQSGSLKVRLIGGYYQMTLSCPTEGVETSITLESLVGCLEALDERLQSPGCVWTPDFVEQKKARQARV